MTKPRKPRPRAHPWKCECDACKIYAAHPHKRERGLALVAIQEQLDAGADRQEMWECTMGYAIYVEGEIANGRLFKSGVAIRKKDGTSLLYPERFYERGEWDGWGGLYTDKKEKADAAQWWYSRTSVQRQEIRDRAHAAGIDPYGDVVRLYRFAARKAKREERASSRNGKT